MKQLIGGVAGALITGIAILGWNGHAASDETAWTDAREHGPVQLVSDRVAAPALTEDEAAPALRVTCEPGQRAVVRAPATAGAIMDAGCVSRRARRSRVGPRASRDAGRGAALRDLHAVATGRGEAVVEEAGPGDRRVRGRRRRCRRAGGRKEGRADWCRHRGRGRDPLRSAQTLRGLRAEGRGVTFLSQPWPFSLSPWPLALSP
jgi:hypothetical protein